jgi:hypothetical protein
MYKGHMANIAERLRTALDAIEQQCFEQVEGLREVYPRLTPLDRNREMSMRLDEPAYKKWRAFSELHKQIAG